MWINLWTNRRLVDNFGHRALTDPVLSVLPAKLGAAQRNHRRTRNVQQTKGQRKTKPECECSGQGAGAKHGGPSPRKGTSDKSDGRSPKAKPWSGDRGAAKPTGRALGPGPRRRHLRQARRAKPESRNLGPRVRGRSPQAGLWALAPEVGISDRSKGRSPKAETSVRGSGGEARRPGSGAWPQERTSPTGAKGEARVQAARGDGTTPARGEGRGSSSVQPRGVGLNLSGDAGRHYCSPLPARLAYSRGNKHATKSRVAFRSAVLV
jgi:hypothetical protein